MNVYLLVLFFICNTAWSQVDLLASKEAKLLFWNLKNRSITPSSKIIYGQQNAFLEGRGWYVSQDLDWTGKLPESDLMKVARLNPGLVGFDMISIRPQSSKLIANQMRAIHQKKGVITLSWHMPNFKADGTESNAWDVTGETVKNIINNQIYREHFYKRLDRLVAFLNQVKDVPIIFRPFHEHNYSWFWWGKDFCTPMEYKTIWLMVQNYLKTKGIHNLLYAYSPNNVGNDYFERYPGNQFVDILGVDFYFHAKEINLGRIELQSWKKQVYDLISYAQFHNKIPAVTEIGNEGIVLDHFWTDYFAWPVERAGLIQFARINQLEELDLNLAYIMVWRNDDDDPIHYFGPIPNHAQNANFFEVLKKDVFSFIE